MNTKFAFPSLFALGLLTTSCATGPKVDPNIDWNSRIGSYTYEQAAAELGRPMATGESNEGRTADWLVRSSPRMSVGFGVGQSVYGSHTAVGVGAGTTVSPPPSGEYLRLTFGPDGKLKSWNKTRY